MKSTRSQSRSQAEDAIATEVLITKASTSVKHNNNKRKTTNDTAEITGKPDMKIFAASTG